MFTMSIGFLLLAAVLVLSPHVTALPRILVYTKTAGYRHESIPIAIETITALGNGSLVLPSSAIDNSIAASRWSVLNTEDQTLFHNYSWLAQFDAISFVSTSDVDPPGVGTVLDDQGLANFARYIQQGGNFIGIHAAAVTLYGAPFYGRLLGAYFDYHPQIQNVTVQAIGASHPSTSKWPQGGFEIFEEMYNFRSDPRTLPNPANLIVTNASVYQDSGINPLGFRNGTNGPSPHPLAWWREGRLLDEDANTDPSVRGGGGANIQVSGGSGRSWFTSLGHDVSTWQTDLYRGHIAGGIGWVLQSTTRAPTNGTSSNGTQTSQGPAASSTPTTKNGVAYFGPKASLLTCVTALACLAGSSFL